jgi:CubicO group peptidase (beta-lactamase class C family)
VRYGGHVSSRTVAAALLIALTCAPGPALASCPELAAWPTEAWVAAPAPVAGAVEALERYAFPPRAEDRRGLRTDALVVVRDGQLVYERYADGYGPDVRHVAWSASKSLTAALTGVALARGALGLDDSICAHLPGPGRHCEVTVRHLLQLASGLEWSEGYEAMAPQASSVLAMLYGVGARDMARFVLGHRRRAPAGAQFSYSSGDSVVLAAVLRGALEPRLGPGWPEAALLAPLGMRSAVLERDAAGTPVGSSLLHATPRDLARLGLLYLADGCWRGARLLPEGFVATSTAVSTPMRTPAPGREPGDVYGLGWWLNRPVPELGQAVPWPGAPEDAFAARGHWGQLVAVLPTQRLVVVRSADDREPGALDLGHLLALAVAVGRAP